MYIQNIIDELSTKILICKNLTYQLYFTNKDMFYVKHIFYFGIFYNTIFYVDILVDYLINNIFYYSNVSRETLQYLLYYFL